MLVVVLFALLGLLAWLQYAWLGQISDATRERLQTRLKTDSRRFAEDFNKEIRNSYFFFQVDPGDWLKNDWTAFNARYKLWRAQTAYPQLIKNIYFVRREDSAPPIVYNAAAANFEITEWTAELRQVKDRIQPDRKPDQFQPTVINHYTLLLPNYAAGRQTNAAQENEIPNIETDLSGYLVIALDETTVKQMLADLAGKHFPGDDPARFDLTVSDKTDGQIIFPANQSTAIPAEESDFSTALFDLTNTNFAMVLNSKVFTRNAVKGAAKNSPPSAPRFPQIVERLPVVPPPKPIINDDDSVKVQLTDNREVKMSEPELKGLWLLNVRHKDGSLERFIGNTRHKNLAVSFGILALLAVSVGLIFLTSRRAQILAQRQLDFVSAVSHEFRTPLAVIYSAGENLTDGVIIADRRVSQYGKLIKREGKKLSAMVEQILEFAGARSGRRKYDFRPTNVKMLIEKALEECRSLIAENDFTVETDIAENLPEISADANALSHAVQNLITNAVKYSDENKWIKITARNGNNMVKITVEDRGIGISTKDISNVFTPFYRAKSVVDAQIHGNGLGLSLVKQTIEAHGGKIFVKSEKGSGSAFTIHLPEVV